MTEARGVTVLSASRSWHECSASAVLEVDGHRTPRLLVGDTSHGVTLAAVDITDAWPRWVVTVCR